MKKIFNLNAVESITAFPKKHNHYVMWREASHSFWHGTYPEGFYYGFSVTKIYSVDELEEGKLNNIKLLVYDKKVYFRPYIEIKFISGDNRIIVFDTYGECDKYVEQFRKDRMPPGKTITFTS